MRKNFVLDTNVLLHDPNSLFSFEEHAVIIPIYVIEEVDKFKKDMSELGRSAREVCRTLDRLRKEGSLSAGIDLPSGGTLRVGFSCKELPASMQSSSDYADNRILSMAMDIKESHNFSQTILVTKDINLRVRADALGIEVEDYDAERQEISELYTGFAEIEMSGNDIDLFYSQGYLSLTDPYWFPNQFIHIKDYANPSHSALGKVSVEQERILPILRSKEGVWGVRPRNKEQAFALDLLMDDSIKLVTLVGKAGTGKTLVAMAAGLHKVTEESKYQRVSVARPIMPMGKDIGFIPGEISDKMRPWMQPIFDNVEFLMGLSADQRRSGRSYQELIDLGIIQVEPLTYIRGRSIPYQFLVLDEAQNTSPHEIKTILSRAGDGTKIVITGDPYQIDSPYLDSMSNGLTHVVNAFKAERIAGHITLTRGERSELAELAANLL